jgi:hypothetical protein
MGGLAGIRRGGLTLAVHGRDRLSLLGHSSVKVSERRYVPWMKARQELLETEVRRIWSADHTSA